MGSDNPSNIEWTFKDRGNDGTYVDKVVDSTGGFTLVLAAAKAYLEHGIERNIVADRF